MNESIALVQSPTHLVTADELLQHPEWDPCELIRGKVIFMAPPGEEHGFVALNLGALINIYVRKHKLGRSYAAETGFILQRDPDTVRAPDVAFVTKKRLPEALRKGGYVQIAPDLAVEVLSPSDTKSKAAGKALAYIEAGTRLVWIVDPAYKTVRIYKPGVEALELTQDQTLSGEDVLPGFKLQLREIFVD